MSIDRDGDGPPLRRQEPKASLTPGEGRGGDLRATPFTDDVFNDDYYGRRVSRSEGSRSFSVILGVALGVAVAAGAGWYFLKGSGLTFTPGEVGFIKADPTPYKIRPENPGGMQVENQDKLVYDRVAKGNAPARVENLLPPAEEPKAPPPKPKVEAPPEPVKTEVAKAEPPKVEAPANTEPAKIEPPKAEAAKVEPAAKASEVAKAAELPKPAPVSVPAKEAAKPATPEADPLAAAVAAATGGRTSATGSIAVAPQSAAPAATTPTTTPPAAAPPTTSAPPQVAAAQPSPAPGASGGFQIQLASVLSEQAAQAEWNRISGKHKDILGGFMPAVSKADLGERGVFYRLRTGPLADKAAADALCASLAAVNVGCIVIKP